MLLFHSLSLNKIENLVGQMLHTLVLILRYHYNINIDVLYGRKKDGFSSFNRVFFQKACKMAPLDMLDAIAYI